MPDLDHDPGLQASESGSLARLVAVWRATREPIRLSLNDSTTLLVRDEESVRLLFDLVDRLELLEDIRLGAQELDRGQGLSLEQARDRTRRKYGIPL